MDYIPDRTLYCAVMFALRMMEEKWLATEAITRAATYYGVAAHSVTHYVNQVIDPLEQPRDPWRL
jgi:hypothetical protein